MRRELPTEHVAFEAVACKPRIADDWILWRVLREHAMVSFPPESIPHFSYSTHAFKAKKQTNKRVDFLDANTTDQLYDL